jgi:hypothetical protein
MSVEREGVGADDEGVRSVARKRRKRGIDLADGAGVEDVDLQPHGASRRFHASQCRLGSRSIVRIDEHGHPRRTGHKLTQQLQPLRRQLGREKIDPRQVAARPGEARNKTKPDRVFGDDEDDGDRRGCRLGRACPGLGARHGNHVHLPADQIGCQFRKPIELTFRPAIFDGDVTTLDIAGFHQRLSEGCKATPHGFTG